MTYGGICTRTGIPSHGTSTAYQGQPHRNTKGSHLLKGILFDAGGERLSPSHSTKRIKGTRNRGSSTRRYNYYVSASLMRGQSKSDGGGKTGLRLSATELDALVMQSLKTHLRNRIGLA